MTLTALTVSFERPGGGIDVFELVFLSSGFTLSPPVSVPEPPAALLVGCAPAALALLRAARA